MTNRQFVMASFSLFVHYHYRIGQIDSAWPLLDAESLQTMVLMRHAERDALRREVRERVALGDGGSYLIPI
jgi:hypothetical protein